MVAILFFETEYDACLSLNEQAGTDCTTIVGSAVTADVSVDDMVLSSIFHKDAVVMGTNSIPGVECFSRVKGGNRFHYGNEYNPVFKDNHSIYIGRTPMIYKYHGNLSLLFSRSADKYVFAVGRIII